MPDQRPDAPMTITLTRGQRDSLYGEIVLEVAHGGLDDIESSLKHGDGERVRQLRDNVVRAMRLLDDLGWNRIDERDAYPITMPAAELATYARRRAEETEGSLRDNSLELAAVAAGRDPAGEYRERCGGSVEEDVADLRRMADSELDVLDACRSILRQLGES